TAWRIRSRRTPRPECRLVITALGSERQPILDGQGSRRSKRQELAEALRRPKGRRDGGRTLHGLPAVGACTEVKCWPVIAALGGEVTVHGGRGGGQVRSDGGGQGGSTPPGEKAGGAGGRTLWRIGGRRVHRSQVPACDRGPGIGEVIVHGRAERPT